METVHVSMFVETPIHISSPDPPIPSGYWTVRGSRLAVLDVERLADDFGLERIADIMRDIGSGNIRGYMDYYTTLPHAPAVKTHHIRGNITLFIRDGNGNVYVPGSSIKGSLRTALIGTALEKGRTALSELLRDVYGGNYNSKHGFQNWYRRHVGDPHNDPFRAVSISDATVAGTTTILEVIRVRQGRRGNPIPVGHFEFVDPKSEVVFTISFDPELWASLAAGTPLEILDISDVNDALTIWKAWDSKVLSWAKGYYDGVVKIPKTEGVVVLGRHTGWATKTLGYLLRNQPRPSVLRRGKRQQGWPLPRTIASVGGVFPGLVGFT